MIAVVNNDIQMVKESKKNNEGAKLALFLQYQGLIKRKYRKFRERLGKSIPLEFEDFNQEAFICLLKSIKYIDEAKIKNDQWLFMGVFLWFLDSMCNRMYKKLTKEYGIRKNNIIDLEEKEKEMFIVSDSFLLDKLVQDVIVRRFIKSLKPMEKIIFQERLTVQLRGNPKPIRSIAEKLGIPAATVGNIVRQLEKKFERFKKVYEL